VTLPPVLEASAAAVAPELRAAAGELSPAMRAVIGYHLGWLDAAGNPAAAGGGKSVRATLALLSARAAGGTDAGGMPGAVAVELVHTFSLLHDDIMDNDEERHHRPAAWTVFGRARAILAGDAVLALAFGHLLAAASPHRPAAVELLADSTGRLIDGQAADLDLEGRVDVTPQECTRMCAGKTGALLECAAAMGAVLAGADAATVAGLRAFGAHLGLAFQAVDDLLGIWGDPAVTGKPVYGDLVQRKSSLPVAIALSAGGDGAVRLRDLLERPELAEAELEAAAGLVEQCGGRAGAAAQADAELRLALDALDAIDIDAGARSGIADVARFVAAREY
jgi:geranylgeranyl diphosphate synthase, type I